MARLTDLQLASLLDEIACAMSVGAPVSEAMRRLQDRRLGAVAKAACVIAEGMERGETLSMAASSLQSPMRDQVAGTLQACRQSGNGELASCMAEQLRRRSQYRRNVRIAWIYPLLLVAIGYGVGVKVMGPTVLDNLGGDYQWPHGVVMVAEWLQVHWYWPPAIVAVMFLFVIMWIAIRQPLPVDVRRGLFCHSLAEQIVHNAAEGVAIKTAAKVSGDYRLQELKEPTLQSPDVRSILEPAGSVDLSAAGAQESLVARLRYLAGLYEQRMRRRVYVWSRLFPRLVMVVLGGGMMLAYVVFVIAPVYRQGAQ